MKSKMTHLLDCWADFEDLTKASQILEWDQETKMPSTGAPARSNQLATLAKVAHERLVSPDFKKALKDVSASNGMSAKDAAMVREARREHDRATRIPVSLVEEVARAESVGLEAWRKAYRTDRWREFSRELTNLVRLKRRVADAIGYANEPYDALLDMYEPGATVAELDPLLGGLRDATIPLVQRIGKSKRRPNRGIVTKKYPKDGQLEFSRIVVAAMGFDFDGGRIDLSTHPFCSGFSPGDVRLTTRVNERDLRGCLFGSIHEAGHGLYEQGISRKLERTPIGQAISLGVHES
ncbi:carboxypeptidase M32, partial [bacterium]|nr:carboxypeptidase M32 [bacterium]